MTETLKLQIELPSDELDTLVMVAIARGMLRENPDSRWTLAEKKAFARAGLLHLSSEAHRKRQADGWPTKQ